VIHLKALTSNYCREVLDYLWKDPDKDCTFYCDDGQVSVHLALVASISPVLGRCCQVAGDDKLGLSLPGISSQHLSLLTRLLYLGEVVVTKDDKDILYDIAKTVLMIPMHLQFDHPQGDDDAFECDNHWKAEQSEDPSPLFKCDKCLCTFETDDLFKNHTRICNESSVVLDKNLNNLESQEDAFSLYLKPKRKQFKSNLPEQANVSYQEAIKILVCGVCGIRTENFYPLMKRHYETTHFVKEEKTFYCPKESCNKKIASTNSFHSHIHIVHREAKYQCTQCNKKFKTSGSLSHHIARWHTSDRPLVCKQCGEGQYLK